ncbi:MAG TPA: CapA family protein [Spirochaetia bacterium]|nr:CapA family protein [Spirochaetales bacterium]HRY71806.1 CapA family protein [Spirochaetia bacterium]
MARAGSPAARPSARLGLLALSLLASAFLFLSSCSPRERLLRLETASEEAAVLKGHLADHPLPKGWRLVGPAAAGDGAAAASGAAAGVAADAVLSLAWVRVAHSEAGDEAGSRGVSAAGRPSLGRRYLAAAAGLAEPVYSLGSLEAEARGLEPLEGIRLPRRALAVEGLWPGEEGYPYEEELILSIGPAAEPAAERTAAAAQTAAAERTAATAPSAAVAPAAGPAAAPKAAYKVPRELGRWLSRLAAQAESPTAGGSPLPLDTAPRGPATPGRGRAERPFTIGAVGDLAIADSDAPRLSGGPSGLASLFGSALPALSRPDLLVGNLEGVVSPLGEPNPRKRFRFRFPPETPRALASAGFDLFLFANNHGFDYGSEAFTDSLAALEAAGTPFVGAGRSLAEAARPWRAALPAAPGRGLAFIGFARYPDERYGFTAEEAAAGPSKAGVLSDESEALRAIGEAAAAGDFVVVLAHGGEEYRGVPSRPTRELYRRFVDAGADLVLGSHPHVLQGAEAYSGGLIAYSLGNFLFTADKEPPEALPSAMLEFLVEGGEIRGVRLEPVLALEEGTRLDPDRTGAEARFAALCAGLAASP